MASDHGMKFLSVFVAILFALTSATESVSAGGHDETDGSESAQDVEHVSGKKVTVGFKRKLWSSVRLLVAPVVVKREWPLYAYEINKVNAEICNGNAREKYQDLAVGSQVAIIEANEQDNSDIYNGPKVQPDLGDVVDFSSLCNYIVDEGNTVAMATNQYVLSDEPFPGFSADLRINRTAFFQE